MAIDNTNYSDLGSELPSEENIQPWSGEGLSMDTEINFPEPIPGQFVRENYVGSPEFEPATSGTPAGGMNYLLNVTETAVQDLNKNNFGKIYSFDAGPDGNSFYDRYAAYGDEKFDEVGFTPFRDNEANFNAKTTMWNDWSRMMGHSFPVLFKHGFVDGPKSLARALTGDFSGTDLESAKEYEEAAAIGMSSKSGVSAFMNNTVMNFGYTAGIITEAIAEEVGMTLLTGLTGGGFAPVQAVRTGKLTNRIGKAFGKFSSGTKALKNIFTVSKNPNAAQRFWQAANGSKTLKFLNPLENTVETIKSFSKASKSGADLTRLAKVSKTAGSLYRDARNINMAFSESRLEAGMVENDIYKELHAKYVQENDGKSPGSEEQAKMRKQAKKGSLETFWGNAGFIYVTNKITFSNITSPKGGMRNWLKQTQKEVFDVGNQSGKFGRIGKVVYDKSKKSFQFQKDNLKELAKSWWKQPGYATAKKTLGYFKSNILEGFQENVQEVVSRANKKHYVEAYETESVQASMYGRGVAAQSFAAQSNGTTPWDTYMGELEKEFSSTGFETFMSGFMMGTLSSPINAAYPFLTTQYNRMFNKEDYNTWRDQKLNVANNIVKDLNDIADPKKGNLKSMLDSHIVNMGTAEAVSNIQKYGTKKEALDAADEGFIKNVFTMRNSNSTEVFVEMLTDIQGMTDKEVADAVGSISPEEAPKYRERLTNAVNKIKEIDANFKEVEKKFPNPVDLDALQKEEIDPVQIKAMKALHDAWNESVYQYVFFNQSIKDSQKRMASINQEYLKDETLSNLDYQAAKVLFKPDLAIQQAQILVKELEVAKQLEGDPLKSQKIASIKKQLNSLQDFIGAYETFNTFYNRDEKASIIINQLKEEGVENPTDEQVRERLDEEIGKVFDQEKQYKMIGDLKKAHDDYINALAGRDISPMQESLDTAFTQLLDYYKLNQESRKMAKYINILHDPAAFLDLAYKNAEIQEQIQAEKDAMNRKLVDSELDKVELNTLLNELQKINLQLSLDQLIEFKKDKVVPSYFTHYLTGEKYYANTSEYREGLNLIMQKQELSQIKTASIDPATGVELTDKMKSVVEEAVQVFSESPLYENLENGIQYAKNKERFTRVSQVVNDITGEAGVTDFLVRSIITDDSSDFNRIFNKAKWNPDTERYEATGFEFTEATIDAYVEKVREFSDSAPLSKKGYGINSDTLAKMKAELISFLNNQTLASKQARINKLKSRLETTDLNNRSLLEEEIAALEAAAPLEVNKNNLQGILYDLLPRITYESGRTRGTTADDLLRQFFDPNTVELKYDENKITPEAFDALFGPNGYLRPLKDLQLAGEIYIFSNNLTLGDNNLIDADGKKLENVAGSLDLFIVDKQGNRFIIDLKTGKADKWVKYNDPNNPVEYGKFFRNSVQQLAYNNLYFNKTGKDAKVLIFPIATEEDPETGKILTASRPPEQTFAGQESLFTEDPMFIEVTEDISITKDGKTITAEAVNSIVPRKGETTLEVDDDGNLIPGKKKKKPKTEFEIFEADRIARKNKAIQNMSVITNEAGFTNVITNFVDARGKVMRLVESLNFIDKTTGKVRDYTKAEEEKAKKKLLNRLKSISDYEKTDYGRDAKVAATFDNITGDVFTAFVGKVRNKEWRFGMPEEARFTDTPLETEVRIDTVYLNEDGNYVITSENLSNGNLYDVTVTPDGNVIQYVRDGKIQKLDPSKTTDEYFFADDIIVRAKTQEEIDAEKPVEEVLPEGFRYVEDGEVLPAGNYITRLSVNGKRAITNAPIGGAPAVAIVGDTVILKESQFISEDTLPKDTRGMIIYGTPGSGKTTFISQAGPNTIDGDNILIELIESVGFRKIRKDEPANLYIEDFSWSDEGKATGYRKGDIDAMAKEAMEKLAAEGKTIFIGTVALLPIADFLVLAPSNHVGVLEKFDSAEIIQKFKSRESALVEQFKSKGPTSTVNESLLTRIQTEDDTLALYNELNSQNEKLTSEEMSSLRAELDEKASILLNPTAPIYINTNEVVIFINDMQKLKIQSGQDMKVIAIDAVNKKIVVKKSGPGNFKNITMDYQDYLDAVGAEIKSEEDPQSQDEETTTFISEVLNNKEKLNSLDNQDDNIDNYLDESNDEDIFGC
tara:strand:+ start:16219 stop:22590 length:6372 start_codon:yes stop_codon:yes gene_type:complete